jgi:hypothetical protein
MRIIAEAGFTNVKVLKRKAITIPGRYSLALLVRPKLLRM